MACLVGALIIASCIALAVSPASAEPQFENLGAPVAIRELSFRFVTEHPDGHYIAWTAYEGDDRYAVVSARVDTGEVTWIDTARFGRTHIRLIPMDGNRICIYTGNPGRFIWYDYVTGEMQDLGVPLKPASYWLGSALGPDGKWYVGTYPKASLVACDLETGEVENVGRMTEDPKQKYIIRVAIGDDGVIYSAVGLHHRELWSLNRKTGQKTQILPPELTKAQGAPSVWTGADGHVYGKCAAATFRCKPGGIEMGDTKPARKDPKALLAGDRRVVRIDAAGRLVLADVQTGAESYTQTDYEGRPLKIYSIGSERDGKIYGGTLFPGRFFSCDLETGELADLGAVAPGAIQIYDTISHPRGLFLASYMGCKLDFYDPAKPAEPGENPRRITGSIKGHERPHQWELGPDGGLYFGTFPAKGRLGGALVRVDPETLEFQVWDSPITDQSIPYLASVPETGELFGCCSVGGGSSAIPTQKEAVCFLWDVGKREVVWTGKPVPGARSYGRAVRGGNGAIYGIANGKCFAFDPVARETKMVADLPVERLRFPTLADGPAGPGGLIYGLGDDAVFAINPADDTVRVIARHPSITRAHGFNVTQDGVLYYGSGTSVWRCRLAD